MKEIFYGLEKMSLLDYEGYMVATIFTKGCNFRCPYCHNSGLVTDNCIRMIPFSEIKEYLLSRKNILDGVCISGGEPTLNKELPEYIKLIKDMGFLVKLDTNGSNPEMLKSLIDQKLIDYVAVDIKNGLSGYSSITGISNPPLSNLMKTINILKEHHVGYEFRTTLVNEYHTLRDIKEIGLLLKGEEKLYLQKFVDHGTCIKQNLNPVPKEKALEFQDLLKNYIKNVYLRGY